MVAFAGFSHTLLMTSAPMPQQNNSWFTVSIGLMCFIVGFAVATGLNMGTDAGSNKAEVVNAPAAAPTPPPPPAGDVPPVDAEVDHILGATDAPITIIEYSDLECPFCGRHHPTMEKLVEEYDGKVNWVYRHFPLSFHPNAQKAGEASECAGELGGEDAFWTFVSALLDGRSLSMDTYKSLASDLGIDADALEGCVNDGTYAQKVKDDFAGGSKAGVRGTPGNVIVNNETEETQLLSGALPYDRFAQIIDEILAE